MNNLETLMQQKYNIAIKSLTDGTFVAEIPEILGLCAYGNSEIEALQELELIKETAFSLILEQGKDIPKPALRLKIPIDDFNHLSYKDELEKYIVL